MMSKVEVHISDNHFSLYDTENFWRNGAQYMWTGGWLEANAKKKNSKKRYIIKYKFGFFFLTHSNLIHSPITMSFGTSPWAKSEETWVVTRSYKQRIIFNEQCIQLLLTIRHPMKHAGANRNSNFYSIWPSFRVSSKFYISSFILGCLDCKRPNLSIQFWVYKFSMC